MKNATTVPDVKGYKSNLIPLGSLSITGVKINKKFMSTITTPKMWLTSDNINVYLHLLAQDSNKNIHIVDSGWFSHH